MNETEPKPVAYLSGTYREFIEVRRDRVPLGVEVSLVNLNWPGQIPLYPASAIAALMEENERLAAELDRAAETQKQWAAEAEAAEQKLADAVKVLEPFANYIIPDPDPNSVSGERFGEKPELAHFRAARRFIKEAGE